MSNQQKISLAVLSLLFSTPLLANTPTTAETILKEDQKSLPEIGWEMISTNPLFADGKVNVTLRNMWKYLKTADLYNTKTHQDQAKEVAQAWGQGIEVAYNSGYFADFIGFDVTYYGAIKLAASDKFSSRAILYKDENGDAKGYNKIGQRYVKIKLGKDGNRFDGKAGWIVMRNVGILTTSTRLSNNSYNGYYGKYTFQNYYAELAYVTSTSRRDSPHKVQFKTFNKQVINHITMGDLGYKDKTTNVLGFYGEAESYIRQFGIEASQRVFQHLTLGTQIYAQYAVDKNDKMWQKSSRPFDSKAWHYALVGSWWQPKWEFKLGVGYTHAPKTGAMGVYQRNIVSNTRGRFNSMAYADIDYMRDSERYIGMNFEYKLVPGYSVGIRNMNSHNKYHGNKMHEHNLTLFNYWNPTWMKNFSVYADVGYGWHYKNASSDWNTPVTDRHGNLMRSQSLAGSMTATYRF